MRGKEGLRQEMPFNYLQADQCTRPEQGNRGMQRKLCRCMSTLWTIKRVHETNEARMYACMLKGVLCKSSPVWRLGRDLCSTSTFLGTCIVQWKQVHLR